MQGRFKHRKVLYPFLEEVFLTRTREEWVEIFIEMGVGGGPIKTLDEVVVDPQVLHRRMIVEMDHPICGKLKVTGNPIKLSGSNEEVFEPHPALGQHTQEILRDVLGYSSEKIGELKRAKVI